MVDSDVGSDDKYSDPYAPIRIHPSIHRPTTSSTISSSTISTTTANYIMVAANSSSSNAVVVGDNSSSSTTSIASTSKDSSWRDSWKDSSHHTNSWRNSSKGDYTSLNNQLSEDSSEEDDREEQPLIVQDSATKANYRFHVLVDWCCFGMHAFTLLISLIFSKYFDEYQTQPIGVNVNHGDLPAGGRFVGEHDKGAGFAIILIHFIMTIWMFWVAVSSSRLAAYTSAQTIATVRLNKILVGIMGACVVPLLSEYCLHVPSSIFSMMVSVWVPFACGLVEMALGVSMCWTGNRKLNVFRPPNDSATRDSANRVTETESESDLPEDWDYKNRNYKNGSSGVESKNSIKNRGTSRTMMNSPNINNRGSIITSNRGRTGSTIGPGVKTNWSKTNLTDSSGGTCCDDGIANGKFNHNAFDKSNKCSNIKCDVSVKRSVSDTRGSTSNVAKSSSMNHSLNAGESGGTTMSAASNNNEESDNEDASNRVTGGTPNYYPCNRETTSRVSSNKVGISKHGFTDTRNLGGSRLNNSMISTGTGVAAGTKRFCSLANSLIRHRSPLHGRSIVTGNVIKDNPIDRNDPISEETKHRGDSRASDIVEETGSPNTKSELGGNNRRYTSSVSKESPSGRRSPCGSPVSNHTIRPLQTPRQADSGVNQVQHISSSEKQETKLDQFSEKDVDKLSEKVVDEKLGCSKSSLTSLGSKGRTTSVRTTDRTKLSKKTTRSSEQLSDPPSEYRPSSASKHPFSDYGCTHEDTRPDIAENLLKKESDLDDQVDRKQSSSLRSLTNWSHKATRPGKDPCVVARKPQERPERPTLETLVMSPLLKKNLAKIHAECHCIDKGSIRRSPQ